jgi:hypothetical protein
VSVGAHASRERVGVWLKSVLSLKQCSRSAACASQADLLQLRTIICTQVDGAWCPREPECVGDPWTIIVSKAELAGTCPARRQHPRTGAGLEQAHWEDPLMLLHGVQMTKDACSNSSMIKPSPVCAPSIGFDLPHSRHPARSFDAELHTVEGLCPNCVRLWNDINASNCRVFPYRPGPGDVTIG